MKIGWLKFAVVLFAGAWPAVSCCPCRGVQVSATDSVRVETRVRREVVHDTVRLVLPNEHERVVVRDTASRVETSLAVSHARINPDGTLWHDIRNKCADYTVAVAHEVEVRDSTVWRERTEVREVPVPRPLTRWQRFRMNGFWVLLAAVLLIVKWAIS